MSTAVRTSDEVIKLVRQYVDTQQPDNYRLVVKEAGARQDEDWWYILVQPDRGGVRTEDYAERLTKIEDEILEKEGVHVLLVPVLVGD